MVLTVLDAHLVIGKETQAVGAGTGDARRMRSYPRSRQAKMRTMTVDGSTVVHAIRLTIWMIYVDNHRVLQLVGKTEKIKKKLHFSHVAL